MAETAQKKTNENPVTYFAKTNFRNKEVVFGVKSRDRRQHMYVIGKTGTGKTTLLNNLALQDIKMGRGICIVDPHGEFVENILQKIPDERMGDVIYFNPADTEYPIGFNVLEVSDEKYKHLVASDLMGIFTKIWANVWSARMEYILNNCVLALLDTPGTTLLGIPRILVDQDYRQKILANVKDPVVKAFWIHEYEGYNERFRGEAIAPIQNKVGQFLSTPLIRSIVGQETSSINIQDIMNSGKILLVNVSKGRIGEDNSALLGAMLITKIQLAAMERIRIPESERRDFYLYVDEFQNFATDSFAGILSEARKYALNLVVAHQYIGQLVTDVSTKVRDAIFGNVGTMIVFRVGAADAEFLEPEFTPEFVIQDLVNLPNREIYVKLMVDGTTSRPFSASTLPPMAAAGDEENREKIIAVSREHYARPIDEVTDQINRWSGIMQMGDTGGMSGRTERGEQAAQYEISCSNCGKRSRVNFAPDPGRPVYCQDCLKKIKTGELSPLRMRRIPAGRGEGAGAQNAHLGDLGIEFEAPAGAPPIRDDVSNGASVMKREMPSQQREPRSFGLKDRGERGFSADGRKPEFARGEAPRKPIGRFEGAREMRREPRPFGLKERGEIRHAPMSERPAPDREKRFGEAQQAGRRQPEPFRGRPFRGEPVLRAPQKPPTASLSILQKKESERKGDVPREEKEEHHKKELDVAGLRTLLEESLGTKHEARNTPNKSLRDLTGQAKHETSGGTDGKIQVDDTKKAGTLKPGERVRL